MSTISPLLRELVAASRLAVVPSVTDARASVGLAGGALPLFGFAPVGVEGGFYQPEPEGCWALICGAFEQGRLIDLVATSFRRTAQGRAMKRRTGEAEALGLDAIQRARHHEQPLCLFDHAFAWLAASGHGAVILDWRAAPFVLADLPAIVCQSDALATRVARAFALPSPPLYVQSKKEMRHAA